MTYTREEFNKIMIQRLQLKPIVENWRDTAIADSWIISQTYAHEPIEQAFQLTRGGFVIQGLCRPIVEGRRSLPEYDLCGWGPDGLQVEIPYPYNWEQLNNNLLKCTACGEFVDRTLRYSFAGRCCEQCRPAMAAKYEQPGWCD